MNKEQNTCQCNDAACINDKDGRIKVFASNPDKPVQFNTQIQDCPKRMSLEMLESFRRIK